MLLRRASAVKGRSHNWTLREPSPLDLISRVTCLLNVKIPQEIINNVYSGIFFWQDLGRSLLPVSLQAGTMKRARSLIFYSDTFARWLRSITRGDNKLMTRIHCCHSGLENFSMEKRCGTSFFSFALEKNILFLKYKITCFIGFKRSYVTLI